MPSNTRSNSESIKAEPAVEAETPKATPILNIAWARYAQLNAASKRRSRAFRRLRLWIAALGILATLFAILTEASLLENLPIAKDVLRIFFVSIPIIASVLAAFGTRAFSNGDWLVSRAAAEEYVKEIYLYRTILQKKKSRRSYLEKRIYEIQKQLYRALGGELALRPYTGRVPPYYDPNDPESDSGYHDLNGDEYFHFRLDNQLHWHENKVNEYKKERGYLAFLVLAAGGLGAFFAAWDGPLSIWVALTASVTAALMGWQELRNIDAIIKNYSKVILELSGVHDHWLNLEPEERTTAQFYRMVRATEDVLWGQHMEYIQSQREALQEADLEEEAGLVNRVIQESTESESRVKQALHESIMEFAKETLEETEEGFQETFKAAFGSLAEEASSEIVQQELEALGKTKTAAGAAETIKERASSLTSSLQQIAHEFADVEVGRDTTKEELNAILARFPKTNDVKG